MARHYPRGYYIVRDGEIETVTVANPVQEAAVTLRHAEATGTMKEEIPDFSWLRIGDDQDGEE